MPELAEVVEQPVQVASQEMPALLVTQARKEHQEMLVTQAQTALVAPAA